MSDSQALGGLLLQIPLHEQTQFIQMKLITLSAADSFISGCQVHAVIPPRKYPILWSDRKQRSLERNKLLKILKLLG